MSKKKRIKQLEADNKSLRQQLMRVCAEPDSVDALTIIQYWRLLYNMEKNIWSGRTIGIMNQIEKSSPITFKSHE